jgi:hypothetical protein
MVERGSVRSEGARVSRDSGEGAKPPGAGCGAEPCGAERAAFETPSSITGSQTPVAPAKGSERLAPRIGQASIGGEGGQNTSARSDSTPLRVLGYRVDALTVGYQAGLDEETIGWFRAAHDRANGVVRFRASAESGATDFDACMDEMLRDAEIALNQAGPGRVPQVAFSVGQYPFALDARRARGGAFMLRNGDCTVLVGLDERGWDVEIKWEAVAIATKGHAECMRLGRSIIDALRATGLRPGSALGRSHSHERVRERLRRFDLCADVEGLGHTETFRWTMRAKKQGEYRVRSYLNGQDHVTGRTFGDGSALMGRVYDKTLELKQMHAPDSEKTLTEQAAWRAAGWDGMKPVTRVEFELKREALESFSIETADDLTSERLRELWSYLTGKWLRYNDGKATRGERCQVDPRWELIQSIPFATGVAPPLERIHGRKRGATSGQACGVVLSALAADRALPKGSTVETIIDDMATAFGRMFGERFTPGQALLAVEGYRASQAEITEAMHSGQRPNACLPSKLREVLRKRSAA